MELTRRDLLAQQKAVSTPPALATDATRSQGERVREAFTGVQGDLSALDAVLHKYTPPRDVREGLDALIASVAAMAETIKEMRP